MNRFFAVFIVVLALLIGVGFYRGWFALSSLPDAESKHVDVQLRVDKGQMERDAEEVKQEASDLLDKFDKQTSGAGENPPTDR
jgi:hypothetical protein